MVNNKETILKIENMDNKEINNKKATTKMKLFNALNNMNDELNVKIDSKEKFKNAFNLNCFINKPKNSLTETNKEKYQLNNLTNDNVNMSINSPFSDKNMNMYNTDNKDNKDMNFYNTDNKDISPSNTYHKDNKDNNLNNTYDKNNKDNNLNNPDDKDNKDMNLYNTDNKDMSNNNTDNKNYRNFKKNENYDNEMIPVEKLVENEQNKSPKIITLRNLDEDDKEILEDMEKNKVFKLNDIYCSIKPNNPPCYDISVHKFNIKQLLNYYLYLIQQIEKLKNNNNFTKDSNYKIQQSLSSNDKKNNGDNNKNLKIRNNNKRIVDSTKNSNNSNNLNDQNNSNNQNNRNFQNLLIEKYKKDLDYFSMLISNFLEETNKI